MGIDFFAREYHHQDHARAIASSFGLDVKTSTSDLTENIVCVFCYGDLRLVDRLGKKIIFCEHGVGMFYNGAPHPSYAGSKLHRDNVILRLSPNKTHADKEMETLKCRVKIVGVPKLDKYTAMEWRVRKYRPTIAISFHWDCLVNTETRSSFKYFEKVLPLLASKYEVIGHGHPRIINKIIPYYRKYGIKYTHDFDTVMRKADVYICDNSSTIYEFGITEKPIVLLNPPFYRREVEHKGNPRFWKHADIAPLVNKPEEIVPAIEEAISNHDYYLPKIRSANANVLTFTDGKCTQRAVRAITELLIDIGEVTPRFGFTIKEFDDIGNIDHRNLLEVKKGS